MGQLQESFIKTVARNVAFNFVNAIAFIFCRQKKEALPPPFPARILVIELSMLGDLLISTPFFASLRKTFFNAKITLVCTPWSKDAIIDTGFFDEIFIYEAFWEDKSTQGRPAWKHLKSTVRLLRMLCRNSFDLCFAVASRKQPFIPLVAFLSRAATRVGIRYGVGDRFLTHSIALEDVPLVYAKRTLLSALYPKSILAEADCYTVSKASEKMVMDYFMTECDKEMRAFICISPSTSQKEKLWNIDSWLTVIKHINAQGIKVFLSGGRADFDYVNLIYSKLEDKENCRNIAGKFTINQFAAFIRCSLALITVESAPMHLAGLLGVPCIVLMSRIYDYKKFIPVSKNISILIKEVACAKCEKGCVAPRCMDFTPNEVLNSLNSLLSYQTK